MRLTILDMVEMKLGSMGAGILKETAIGCTHSEESPKET